MHTTGSATRVCHNVRRSATVREGRAELSSRKPHLPNFTKMLQTPCFKQTEYIKTDNPSPFPPPPSQKSTYCILVLCER